MCGGCDDVDECVNDWMVGGGFESVSVIAIDWFVISMVAWSGWM